MTSIIYIIKKLITPFILPPGLFVLVFLSGGIFLVCVKRRKIGSAAIAAGIVMWLMAITPVADMLFAGLTRDITVKGHIPEGDVIIEENSSRNTFENAKKVRRICKRFGFQQPILVTSDYHLKRALWSFRKAGLNCVPFANGLASRKGRSYSWQYYLPGSYKRVSQYLHEYIGLLYYRMVY